MATANSGAGPSDDASADKRGARLAQLAAKGLDRRPIDADGWRYADVDECRCDLATDGSCTSLPAVDQPRLGEEPQPMLPGLEGC